MNNLKKFLSLILAFALILSLSATVLAQEGDGEVYSAVVRFSPGTDTDAMCDALEKLPGVRVRWQYSALFCGAAIEGTRAALALAGVQSGVSALALSRTWAQPETITDPSSVSNSLDVMNGLDCAYDGDGIIIAVLDSGIKTTHETFRDYGIMDTIRLTQEDVDEFAASGGTQGRYISAKIPFAYDYAGQDRSVNTADYHGTHVSALAVGYAQRPDGTVKFRGAASAAQLLCMKVFPDDAKQGADDVDVLKAIEDAYLLGADVINLSLGMTDPFVNDEEIGSVYSEVIAALEAEGVIVCCAVGNEGTALTGKPGDTALPSGGYTDYATICSPAICDGTAAIAAVNAAFYEAGGGILVGDRTILYREVLPENEETVLPDVRVIGGREMPYVVIDGMGRKEDFAGMDLSGCAVVVQRGEILFSEKANNAAAAGAALCIIYNNEPGWIYAAVNNVDIPCVFITQEDGVYLVKQATDGRGMLAVAPEMMRISTDEGVTMLSFSSWGATPDLRLAPTLSAPGGTILSAGIGSDNSYDYLSGTSMATPNASGAYAVLLQALRERGIEDRTQRLALATSLLESTAAVLTGDDGVFLSPRRQGAGVIDISAALEAGAVIDEPIISLGESETGRFTIRFTVKNLSEHEKEFEVDTTVLTDAFVFAEGAMRSALAPMDITDSVTISGTRKIRIAPMSERTVSIALAVPMQTRQLLEQVFFNGFFVEGYVTLTDEEHRSIHATYMGYCGDWEAAPIIDVVDFRDVMDAYYEEQMGIEGALAALVADMGYNYACLCGPDLETYGALLPGENPWLVTRADDVRNAMASVQNDAIIHGGEYLVIDLYTLRNAEHLIFVVSDQRTGEIYFVDDRDYLIHSTVSETVQMAASAARFVWNGSDENGIPLPSGTAVTISFYAWLESETKFGDLYDAHQDEIRNGIYDWLLDGAFEECIEWSFLLVLDGKTPAVSCGVNEDGDTVITVMDEHCVAYAAVQDKDGNYLAEESFADERIGVRHNFTIRTQEYETLYVTAVDYAGNVVGYEVDLSAQAVGEVSMRRCAAAMLMDVEKDAWYHDAVDFVIENGLMNVGDGLTFLPEQGALRISVLELLYDMAGRPQLPQGTVTLPFQDVAIGAVYREALEWAYSAGVVNGYDEKFFGAYAPVRRTHLAAMLYRAAIAAGEDVTCSSEVFADYSDADDVPEWAKEAICWALEKGYLIIDKNGPIDAEAYVTRAEFAHILMKFYRT